MEELLSDKHGKEPGILVEYLDYLCEEGGITSGTAYNYYMSLRYLAKFLKHSRKNMDCLPSEVIMKQVTAEEMLSITEDEWDAFLDNCQFTEHETHGAHAVRISIIRGFYKWLAEKHDSKAPEFILTAKRPRMERRSFICVTSKMEQSLYEHLTGEYLMRNACIIHLCMRCGLGLSEICALDLEDIDLENIQVRESNGQYRTIPLDAETLEAIDSYLSVRTPPKKDGNPFFVSAKEGRMRRGAVQKMLRKAVKLAGPNLMGVTLRDMQMTARRRMFEEKGIEAAVATMNVKSPYYLSRAYTQEFAGSHNAAV